MTLRITSLFLLITFVQAFIVHNDKFNITIHENSSIEDSDISIEDKNITNAFDGVYSECFLHLSYSCIQEKTLLYLKELNKLSEVSLFGDYVKFVKINGSKENDSENTSDISEETDDSSEELSISIDRAVDDFFRNHVLKFKALGKDVAVPNTVEEFVGRKRKGGGGGGGGGHDDGGKKKMMMMAMMCMKMKLMIMVPAMMGMMGMMSFKGMMFSMMSFMVSKMMLLMKILEKKGGGGGGGGGGDGGWAAGGGGGGGAWMPAGGQDYGGGGGGGGYDANAQWQQRSIVDFTEDLQNPPIIDKRFSPMTQREPIISYVTPHIRYSHVSKEKRPAILKNLNDEIIKANQGAIKTRKKRGIVDFIQNSYLYLAKQLLGLNPRHDTKAPIYPRYPNYKVINGVKYVYLPVRPVIKAPKELNQQDTTNIKETPIITAEDFNKGEILEGGIESRSIKSIKKMQKMKNDVEEVLEEDPWE